MIAIFLVAAGASSAATNTGPDLPASFYLDGFVHILSWAFILAGSFFVLVGSVGLIRMPDVFTRMHAAGISDTAGAGLLIIGMLFLAGFSLVMVKLAIILGVIFFTSPIATHALAQAALHAGVEPKLVTEKIMIGPGAHTMPPRASKTSKKPVTKSSQRRATKSSGKKRRARS